MLFSTVKLGFLTWKSLEPALSGPARKLQFLALLHWLHFCFSGLGASTCHSHRETHYLMLELFKQQHFIPC